MYKPTLSISRLVRFQGQSFLKQTTRGFADAPKRSKDKVTKQKDGSYKIEFVTNPFTLHKLQTQPSTTSITTRDEMLNYFRQMSVMRRMEVAADNLYKQKLIRGFLHLYNGQEAIVVGTEASITKDDHVITAYRDHAHHVGRGGTVKEVMAELMGKKAGMSAGKGGSMHMYKADANYHGGNGIVGAQVPIGAGIAFAMKYRGRPNICLASYGDGAANQGQVFEAYNMAALWKVPCLFVCENNKYGMGTSAERAAADTNYFKKGDYVPGLKIDAMNVYAVKEGIKYAKDYALKNGPLVIEMETYRYMGHSMSDPGVGYRSRDEINKAREERDPIDRVRFLMLENNIAKEEELTAIENEIRKEVDDAVEFAKNAPYPEPIELYTDIYSKNSKPYFIRTVELPNSLTIN